MVAESICIIVELASFVTIDLIATLHQQSVYCSGSRRFNCFPLVLDLNKELILLFCKVPRLITNTCNYALR